MVIIIKNRRFSGNANLKSVLAFLVLPWKKAFNGNFLLHGYGMAEMCMVTWLWQKCAVPGELATLILCLIRRLACLN